MNPNTDCVMITKDAHPVGLRRSEALKSRSGHQVCVRALVHTFPSTLVIGGNMTILGVSLPWISVALLTATALIDTLVSKGGA